MLVIPIIILTHLQLPLQRKLTLAIMFSSGIYIIICAILRARYSLGDITSFSNALTWSDRECFVTAIMVSLPGIRPLFQHIHCFGSTVCVKPRARSPAHEDCDNFASEGPGQIRTYISSPCSGSRARHFELDRVLWPSMGSSQALSGGDEENVPSAANESAMLRLAPGNSGRRCPLEIHVTTVCTLESEHGEASRSSRSDS